ncbi:hypothetical protein BRC68_12180 [Halobacteriales archaeon QH_6_64_20]|nr:MAG: hypothetical protein BRC68_12180 [Halobacteriales archaeon QH_6_64_20]
MPSSSRSPPRAANRAVVALARRSFRRSIDASPLRHFAASPVAFREYPQVAAYQYKRVRVP